MAVLKNRAKMSTSTTGTGTITLGSAESGYQTFADAGVANADVVRYIIEDTGGAFEIGTGTYTSSGTTLTRTVSESSNSNNAINLSGSATVFIGAIDDDIAGGPRGVTFNDNVKITLGNGTDGELYSDGSKVILESASSEFVNTDDGAVGPQFYLNHSTSSPATTDYNGLLGFKTTDLGNNAVTPFYISAHTPDVTSGAATGQGKFLVKDDGLSYPIEYFRIDGDAENVGTFKPIKFYEDESNGNQGVVLQGPSSIGGSDVTFTLPSADGSSGQFLKTDGSGNLAFAAAGGGDPDLYRDNASSATTPVASAVNGVAIGNGASSGGSSSSGVAIGFNATVGAGTGGVAIGESYVGNSDAVAFAMNSTSSSYGALGARSVAGAGMAKASGSGSIALGYGSQSTNSISVAIGQNATATAANALALGYNSSATTADSISLGGSATSVKVSGAYTLPTSDGTNGQVLTTDGSGAVTFADAGGGGGDPDLYAANESSPSAQPSATGVNAIAIGDDSLASGLRGMAVGYSSKASGQDSSALGNATASGESSAAVGFYATASAAGAVSIGYSAVASGTFAGCLGFNGRATANSSITLGNSYASGEDSLAAIIDNNSSSYGATGANSIAIGELAKATASDSFCISNVSTASGTNAAVFGGQSNTSSGSSSTVIGGQSNLASGDLSTAKGYYGNSNGIRLKHATGVYPNQQGAYYVLGYTTSNDTPIALNTSVWTPSATNQIVLPNNSAFAFHGTIVARQQAADGTACAAWKVEGLIRREANAGTTVLVNSATTVLDNTPNWGMALSANTSLGCLKIEVTGAASTDIRWVATIHTSEVTYT